MDYKQLVKWKVDIKNVLGEIWPIYMGRRLPKNVNQLFDRRMVKQLSDMLSSPPIITTSSLTLLTSLTPSLISSSLSAQEETMVTTNMVIPTPILEMIVSYLPISLDSFMETFCGTTFGFILDQDSDHELFCFSLALRKKYPTTANFLGDFDLDRRWEKNKFTKEQKEDVWSWLKNGYELLICVYELINPHFAIKNIENDIMDELFKCENNPYTREEIVEVVRMLRMSDMSRDQSSLFLSDTLSLKKYVEIFFYFLPFPDNKNGHPTNYILVDFKDVENEINKEWESWIKLGKSKEFIYQEIYCRVIDFILQFTGCESIRWEIFQILVRLRMFFC